MKYHNKKVEQRLAWEKEQHSIGSFFTDRNTWISLLFMVAFAFQFIYLLSEPTREQE